MCVGKGAAMHKCAAGLGECFLLDLLGCILNGTEASEAKRRSYGQTNTQMDAEGNGQDVHSRPSDLTMGFTKRKVKAQSRWQAI